MTRPSDEKRVLQSHDLCQGRDSCGFQGARAARSGGCVDSHVPWSYNSSSDLRNFVNVLLCLAARPACCLARQTHTRIHRVCLLSLTSHPWHRHGAAAPRSSTAQFVNVKTHTLEVHADLPRKTHGDFLQVYLARHTNLLAWLLSMTSQPPRGRGAAAPHTAPFVTVRTHATSRLSGHCASTDDSRVWPLLMNCVSSFNALHSTQFFFFARMSDHG